MVILLMNFLKNIVEMGVVRHTIVQLLDTNRIIDNNNLKNNK